MSPAKWVAAMIVAIVIGTVLGYGFARRGATDDSRMSAASGDRQRKVLYWHDPMVPGVKFDQPGKSPFMDMQLVPVYADESGGAGVRIGSSMVQNLGIRIGKVEKKALPRRFDSVGSVVFDERLLEVVQARVAGYVTRLHVKAPLERVRRGQPLAEILAPAWLAAQRDYVALLDAQSAPARSIRDAARERLVVLGVPNAAIRAVEKDRRTNPTTTVFAPVDGVVTELAVREGAAFAAGAELLRINGLSDVWVNAQVPEAQAALVAPGSAVEARATAWPGATFQGHVIALLPEVDLQTRTLAVRIAVENPGFRLSPGMFVSLTFVAAPSTPQLVVPSEAVIVTGKRSVVIVTDDEGGFDVADVKVGAEEGGLSVILSGLQEGQSVVLSGQFLIDSEASLGSTVDRLTRPPPPPNADGKSPAP